LGIRAIKINFSKTKKVYVHLAAASIVVGLLLNGSGIVVAQSMFQLVPGTSLNQLSPSMVRIVDGSGTIIDPSLASLSRSLVGSPQVVATDLPNGSRALIVTQDPNSALQSELEAPLVVADVRQLNPNLAATDVRVINPGIQARLQEVPNTVNTLNPPFRLCQGGDPNKLTYSNFATYTIAGKADFSDLIEELDNGGEDIMLQLYVDYDTATVKGFLTVGDDKLKTIQPPLQDPRGDTARQTVDEAGTVRLEISQFKPIFNTECERTVTGEGGIASVPTGGQAEKMPMSERAHLHLPFKTCEVVGSIADEASGIQEGFGRELKSAIWTIQGFNNIQRLGDNVDGGDTPFNMQIYNDLLTGTIKGTLFVDYPNNGIVDIADTNDDVGDRVEFNPVITGECYRQPSYNL
jgi:hypothetical protein